MMRGHLQDFCHSLLVLPDPGRGSVHWETLGSTGSSACCRGTRAPGCPAPAGQGGVAGPCLEVSRSRDRVYGVQQIHVDTAAKKQGISHSSGEREILHTVVSGSLG